MRSQWEDITVKTAREALTTERCGRSPSSSVVERYARDMENGRWRKTPEPLVYDGEDTGTPVLRDGKQRMLAIILAGERLAERGEIAGPEEFGLTMWVTRGTTAEIDEAFPVLNIGKNRTGTDYLTIEGRRNPTLLFTVGRRIVLWNNGKVTGNTYKPTRSETLEVLEMQDDSEAELERVTLVEQAADFAAAWSLKPPVPAAGIAGFLWWLLGQKSEAARDVFLEYLRTGAGLPDEAGFARDRHPLIVLRQRLHADFYESRKRGTTVRQETVLYLCLRAWDAWRRHEEMTKLQMPRQLSDSSFRPPR